ncbi:hypothetical protein, partial [Thomasclavelia ramosa]|uniref:hypothetical protein n=1 Tax=Thomasclavelia ramosa TaxID=1547 RepID=UPI003DA1FD1D
TLIFTLLVTATLFFMYDDFVFQTYGEVVYYDYILKGENNQLKVENIEAYLDRQSFHLGEGRIIFKDVNLTNGAVPTVKLSLYGENQQKFDYEFVVEEYHSDNLIYSIQSISKKYKEIDLDDVKSASLTIEANDQKLSEVDLKITPVEQLEGSNKEYRIENASISNSMMRLGTLKAASDDVIKEYPTVSLEYRYLKDKNGDKEDNDNYVVFKKITGKSKELVNGNDYGTYNLEDDSFKDKDLSVVIIFSNGKEKFAFAIDLKTREVGDYYG